MIIPWGTDVPIDHHLFARFATAAINVLAGGSSSTRILADQSLRKSRWFSR